MGLGPMARRQPQADQTGPQPWFGWGALVLGDLSLAGAIAIAGTSPLPSFATHPARQPWAQGSAQVSPWGARSLEPQAQSFAVQAAGIQAAGIQTPGIQTPGIQTSEAAGAARWRGKAPDLVKQRVLGLPLVWA